jgi:hypothetical protein
VDDGLRFLEVRHREGTSEASEAALLVTTLGEPVVDRRPRVGPDGAGLDFAADTAGDVDVVGEQPAARPISPALDREMASTSVSKISKVATGSNTSFWMMSVLTSFTSRRVGR